MLDRTASAATVYLERVKQHLQVGICELRLTQAKLLQVRHDRQGLCYCLAACGANIHSVFRNKRALLFHLTPSGNHC